MKPVSITIAVENNYEIGGTIIYDGTDFGLDDAPVLPGADLRTIIETAEGVWEALTSG